MVYALDLPLMIYFQKITHQDYSAYRNALIRLYVETFSKGLSAQYIPQQDAENYVDALFQVGYGIVGIEKSQPIAALLVAPIAFDKEFPASLQNRGNSSQTLYIAEVLVHDSHRGKGLGSRLMEEFENHLDKAITQVVLRVWDQNTVAVNLYLKHGFYEIGSLDQQKQKPITKEQFTMRKLYMIKNYQYTPDEGI